MTYDLHAADDSEAARQAYAMAVIRKEYGDEELDRLARAKYLSARGGYPLSDLHREMNERINELANRG